MIDPEQLAAACGCNAQRAATWAAPLSEAMDAWGINTPARQAAFLAQIAHESGRLVYVRELWGPTPTQTRYEGRHDLGNLQPGDGFKYRGRGLIQVTGRANYIDARDGMRQHMPDVPDFEAEPELLEQPKWAAHSAAHYWWTKGLNILADAGSFEAITRRINGGLNGQADRLALWGDAQAALGVVA
jgi:putative chitinase